MWPKYVISNSATNINESFIFDTLRNRKISRSKHPSHTAQKVSKYGVISGPCFPTFELNTERYEISLRIQLHAGKYGPEITPYLSTFLAVSTSQNHSKVWITLLKITAVMK